MKEKIEQMNAILENGTKDYAPVMHCLRQYVEGNCPVGVVESAIRSAMEEYASQSKQSGGWVNWDMMREKVFQAMGYVSMCWKPKPEGVFDDEAARNMGNELMKGIELCITTAPSINETLLETATKEPEAFILVNALKMLNNEQLKSTALSMLERTDYKNELLEALKRVRETIIKAGDVFTWASELKIIDNALAGEVSDNKPLEVLRELVAYSRKLYSFADMPWEDFSGTPIAKAEKLLNP